MVEANSQELLVSFKQALFLQFGNIWYLPVSYTMEFPPVLLCEDNQGIYRNPDNNAWKDPQNGRYEPGFGEQEIILKSKTRPFLVFQKPDLLKSLSDLNFPKYYGSVVTGFPITRLKKLEKNSSIKIDVSRLKSRNDYEFIHYISEPESGLSEQSCVILRTPMNIMVDFFTTHIGYLNDSDMTQIKNKVARIFNL